MGLFLGHGEIHDEFSLWGEEPLAIDLHNAVTVFLIRIPGSTR